MQNKLLLSLLLALILPLAHAGEAVSVADDVALEKRVMAVSGELRCLVCQNQTIADSHADLAVDLRNQVREMLQAGKSDKQVVDYMTDRYGDFVLYRPPFKATTVLLWIGPALMVLIGLVSLVLVLRRRSQMPADRFDPDEPEAQASDASAAKPSNS